MKTCPRCGSSMTMGTPHVDGPVIQWECHSCGKIEHEPLPREGSDTE